MDDKIAQIRFSSLNSCLSFNVVWVSKKRLISFENLFLLGDLHLKCHLFEDFKQRYPFLALFHCYFHSLTLDMQCIYFGKTQKQNKKRITINVHEFSDSKLQDTYSLLPLHLSAGYFWAFNANFRSTADVRS